MMYHGTGYRGGVAKGEETSMTIQPGKGRFPVRKFHRLHVRTQELLAFLSLSIVPIICFTVITYGVFATRMEAQAKREMNNTIIQLASSFEQTTSKLEATSTTLIYIERIQKYLKKVSQGEKITRPEVFAMEQALAIFFDSSLMKNIIVFDTKGEYTQFPYDVSGISIDVVLANAEREFHHRPIWVVDADSSKIHLLRPVESMQDFTLLGFLDIVLFTDVFKRQLLEIDLKEQGHIFVLDKNHQYITGTTDELPGQIIQDLAEGNNLRMGKGRNTYYVFSAQSPTTGWTTVGFVSRAFILADLRNLFLVTLAMIIVIVFFAVYLSLLFSNFFSGRIKSVTTAMGDVSRGNLSVRMKPDPNPEFNELSTHFNEMVRKVDLLIDSEYRSQLLKNQAELKMLQAQINPHFLYNTLNVMFWKAQIAEQDDIAQLAVSLANLFHSSIDRNLDYITIAEELQIINDYLFIQKMRYQDKIVVDLSIDRDILQVTIPKLILQPIVENAFVHGIETSKGNGKIVISGKIEGDNIIFTVVDNGRGMDSDAASRLLFDQEEKSYQGCLNVHKRLQLVYGSPYGLSIHSILRKGTTVTITLPKERVGISDKADLVGEWKGVKFDAIPFEYSTSIHDSEA